MANPFSKMQEYFSSPDRTTHDVSFVNNLTMKFGQIVPVFYKDVVPGESFRINPTFQLNFQPLVFPVQTDMKAHLHFFYCRTKDVYKDWLDKFGMTKEGLEMPYMKLTEENRDMVNTGSLGDYLNLPTVTYGEFGNELQNYVQGKFYDFTTGQYSSQWITGWLTGIPSVGQSFTDDSIYIGVDQNSNRPSQRMAIVVDVREKKPYNNIINAFLTEHASVDSATVELIVYPLDSSGVFAEYPFKPYSITLTKDQSNPTPITLPDYESFSNASYLVFVYNVVDIAHNFATSGPIIDMTYAYDYNSYSALENSTLPLSELPFCSDENPDGERLVNLPFRFYEFIYNSFYRDERNNPYKIDGQVEYNKYLPSTEGGADTYHYKLRYANWEQDFLTTATASPQFGVAPLVGITATGTMTFADEEGNTYTAQANVADDGDTITGISVHSPDMPVGTLRALIDTVSSGISISDFRNVNALQRLLEKRMRHGLKYVDMVQASFGTRPKNLEISMPEFIGGVNENVIINRISQTVDTESVPLGTVGGQGGVIGSSKHDISCYCDDFGCIMGLMFITPVPNYSQLLPKYWLKSEALDFFHPEFARIGYQPIFNKEVAPLQFYRDDKLNATDNYNSVFGYQRPWYDYISSVDEVHGNFRNNMRRYLINRVFDTPPALTEEFLLAKPNQINDVFAVTDDTDKIFGQILFRVKRKNAVPTLAIPRLES